MVQTFQAKPHEPIMWVGGMNLQRYVCLSLVCYMSDILGCYVGREAREGIASRKKELRSGRNDTQVGYGNTCIYCKAKT